MTSGTEDRMIEPAQILSRVCTALDALIAAGEPHGGLFPSILDRRTGQLALALPPGIHGQRTGDRSYPGTNLIHDESALATLHGLAAALARPDYAAAANRYFQRWAAHCTETETGLFPWGEHAYWHLLEDRVGNSYLLQPNARPQVSATHDHLRQAPLWLWERLWAANPRCVERFAEGLDYHWKEGEPGEYSRHAAIEARIRPRRDPRSCDFPRHSGFYVFDLAFAYARTRRDDFLAQLRRFMDHWWEKRDARGLLLTESRSPEDDPHFYNTNAPGQTISLAVSLLEAAALLDGTQPDLAATMRERAAVYTGGFYAAPHDVDRGVFVLSCDRTTNATKSTMPVWGSIYGVWPASYIGLTVLCGYRLTRDERHLGWAEGAGRSYLREPFPAEVQVPAMDVGLALGLLADLYDVTGDDAWIEGGLRLASTVMDVYFEAGAPLPRGAAGYDWYDSQMGPGFLLHGLSRLALLTEHGARCPLGPDYTAR